VRRAWDEFQADVERARDPEQRRKLADRINELEGDTSADAQRLRDYIRSVISAAEFPPQSDPHETIAELRRQIGHEIEKLSHDASPSVRRLRKWLQLELDGDAEVRERLWQRESTGPLKGGRTPKRKPGIWQRVLDIVVADPQITAGKVWESFPEHRPGDDESLIYRDGAKLVEVDDRTGRGRAGGSDGEPALHL
jgi:hypothetical protein